MRRIASRSYPSARLREFDSLASSKYRIPAIILMEHAGRAVAEFVHDLADGVRRKVFCVVGTGNNGGDGLAAARLLRLAGHRVSIILFHGRRFICSSEQVIANWAMIKAMKTVPITGDLSQLRSAPRGSIIIDAVFGTGLSRKLGIKDCAKIDYINATAARRNLKVVAVDIPSGLHPDLGVPYPVAVRADYTLTMGFMKLGFSMESSRYFTGCVSVCDIGYPEQITSC